MDVSVMISTWNNAARLALTLDAISRCVVAGDLEWELVLVDNNCTDDTPEVAQQFKRKAPLVYVKEPRQGLSHARNAGLAAARGRLLVFTDDDVTPCEGWIATYVAAHRERPRGFYFGGPLGSEYETARPEEELLRFAGLSVTGIDWGPPARILTTRERLAPANWACPADVVRAAGGFDTRLGLDASLGRRRLGEAFDLMDRLRRRGMQPWYLPGAFVRHFVPARKCSLEHIADNFEAQAVYGILTGRIHPRLEREPRLRAFYHQDHVSRLPLRLSWVAGIAALRWIVARLGGQQGYDAYMTLRFCRGVIRGYRERRAATRGHRGAATAPPEAFGVPVVRASEPPVRAG